ncbi:homoserine kinase [Bacillus chungangensis]|uniref:Homoserine kinase n=1 Tax=Bacillus chungangensis TaxID=587633 RepID=A0ABT9WQT9_9BACI|nr:homoserine kinase [Bacillus chungangensis]MDQ0175503.1 homoserine kinase [Bacillus chungangensis]
MNAWRITAPASSANLGPGFDSIGLALSKYLTIDVTLADEWSFHHQSPVLVGLPSGKKHLIYQVAKLAADRYDVTLPACKVVLYSDIPLARGLGSSAAAIAAGIELVNTVCGLSLTMQEKLLLGTEIEGHPDNICASLLGGMVIGNYHASAEEKLHLIQVPSINLDVVVSIPAYELKTEDARKVLPENIAYGDAIAGSAIANVLIAALMQGDFETAGKMMESDLYHEPYRTQLIPELLDVKAFAKENGAYGSAISGAGPTILTFAAKGHGQSLAEAIRAAFPACQVNFLTIDTKGTHVEVFATNERFS